MTVAFTTLAMAPPISVLAQGNGQNQDSAFLACARFTDRIERIACLEDALEAATVPAAQGSLPGDASRPAAAGPDTMAKAPPKTAEEQVENFGQRPPRVDQQEGGEVLHDTVANLEKRRNLWRITLGSGQVWQQQLARRYNLREGDTISIDQAGFGNGYRLSTERLSGFIRVERVE